MRVQPPKQVFAAQIAVLLVPGVSALRRVAVILTNEPASRGAVMAGQVIAELRHP